MKQISNLQTKDYIAEAIRNEILSGNMKAGEELTQEMLAEILGVSRMPVREALQTLVQEGFVERLPNRHMQVVALNEVQIRDTFLVIAAMEVQVSEIILEKNLNIDRIEEVLKHLETEENEKKAADGEIEFHNAVISTLENKYLEQMYGKLLNGYVTYAVKNLGEKEKAVSYLHSIGKDFEKKNGEGLRKNFYLYYHYYGECFGQQVKDCE